MMLKAPPSQPAATQVRPVPSVLAPSKKRIPASAMTAEAQNRQSAWERAASRDHAWISGAALRRYGSRSLARGRCGTAVDQGRQPLGFKIAKHSTPHPLGHRRKRHNEGKRTEFSSLRFVPMIYVHYASSRTKCICFHAEEMPEGSALRLVATFNDDEVAKAWAFLHKLSSPLSSEPIRGGEGHSG